MLQALVLAAGEGRRMGGPKALLVVGGGPLLARHVARLHEAGCGDVVAVVRPAESVVVGRMVEGRARVVPALTPAPAGSLAAGLRVLAPPPDGLVLVTPVDVLPPRPATVEALVAAVEGGALAATPSHAGRGGHPVVVRARVLTPYLRDAPPAGGWPPLREVLAGLGPLRVRVEVDDAAVLGDFDRPQDLLAVPS